MTQLSHDVSFAELFNQANENQSYKSKSLITGKVIAIDHEQNIVLVDAGLKSEGIIPLSEFQEKSGEFKVAVNDVVELMLETADNGYGETCLSREKAVRAQVWEHLDHAHQHGENVLGIITDRVKGGFTVDLNGVRAFLPGSQVDLKPVKEMDGVSEQEIEFRVVKMDRKRNNVVVSRRAVIEGEGSEERQKVLDALEEGAEVKGVIKNLTHYGAFIDLGGIDGLLHITDMSWKRLKHPSDLLNVGDEILVKVLSYDKEKPRVSLGLKQLSGDPWYEIIKTHPVGSRLFGRVTNIEEYGCFIEIKEGIEGLVHMSEMDWTNKNIHPSKIVEIDQEVEVIVLDIDDSRRRISLGIKQCMPNPWTEFESNHEVGQTITGQVKSLTDFGLFIGLEGNIDGLVHLTDISWTQPGEKAIREYKKGAEVSAVITAIDSERERISLSIRQMNNDPYEDFISAHPAGSKITAVVESVDSKRVIFTLPNQLFGSIRRSDITDEVIDVGQKMTLYISGQERKNHYVPLSVHPTEKGEKSHQNYVDDMAPATLGDLMKEKMKRHSEE
jgi:small subunit ribosomal protein S1